MKRCRLIQLLLISLAYLTLNSSFAGPTECKAGSLAACSKAVKELVVACPKGNLYKERTGAFLSLFKERKYQQAIDHLNHFMETEGCRRLLNSKNDDEVDEYLWAMSDLSLAREKMGNYVTCIKEIKSIQENMGQVGITGHEKVRKAFETNSARCEKTRLHGFSARKTQKGRCDLDLFGKKFGTLILGQKPSDMTLSIQDLESKACVVRIVAYDEKKTPVDEPILYVVPKDGQLLIQSINPRYDGDPDRVACGRIWDLILYNDQKKNLIIRMIEGLAACEGSSRSTRDSMYRVHENRIEQIDELFPAEPPEFTDQVNQTPQPNSPSVRPERNH